VPTQSEAKSAQFSIRSGEVTMGCGVDQVAPAAGGSEASQRVRALAGAPAGGGP